MIPSHGACWLWDPALVVLHAGSDLAIFAAYWAIPWLMLMIARLAGAGRVSVSFPALRLWWVAFILACGVTHLGESWLVWWGGGWFWVVGAAKAIAAVISIGAFVATWRRRRPIVALVQALAEAERKLDPEHCR